MPTPNTPRKGYELHRAVVQSADPVTGITQVKIPDLLGQSIVDVHWAGLEKVGGFYKTPNVGDMSLVAVSNDGTQILWVLSADHSALWNDLYTVSTSGPTGGITHYWNYSNNTTLFTDPGNGNFTMSSTTSSAVTWLQFDNLDADGNNVASFLTSMDDIATASWYGIIQLWQGPNTWADYRVVAVGSSFGGYVKVDVDLMASAGTFVNGARTSMSFVYSGDKGLDGIDGIDGAVLSVTGTTNQVTASPTTGAVVLSLPQNINTTADVAFNSVTVDGASTSGIIIGDRGNSNSNVLYRTANLLRVWNNTNGDTVTVSDTGQVVANSTVQGTQLISTVTTGTAPLSVSSTTKVTSLNADLLDDQSGSYYTDLGNATGTLANGKLAAGYVLHSVASGQCSSSLTPTSTSFADITGATVTISCAVGDLIKMTGHFDCSSAAADVVLVGTLAVAGIATVGAVGVFGKDATAVASWGGAFTCTYWYTATATSHTFKLQGRNGTGGTNNGTFTTNSIIWVERYIPA